MPISSGALFHFTSCIENLFSILSRSFLPRLSLEKISLSGYDIALTYPMICFCDIPLSQIHQFADIYGHYAIGLTKHWATEAGINPVLYLNSNSQFGNLIAKLLSELNFQSGAGGRGEQFERSVELLHRIIKYLKPYSGDFARKGNLYKGYVYYNEREWRYSVDIPKWDGPPFAGPSIYENVEIRKEIDRKLEEKSLKFIPEDMSYVIIDSERERSKTIEFIRDKYQGDRRVDHLISRILSFEQLLSDF